MKYERKLYRKRHFSLIELVVAITILAFLAAVATPAYLRYLDQAKVSSAKSQIRSLKDALMGYKLDVGDFPDSGAGLEALVENVEQNDRWNGPYLDPPRVPKDPWDNDYVYMKPGQNDKVEYEIISYGSDGTEGGEKNAADITSAEL